jgi:hypothetical protein
MAKPHVVVQVGHQAPLEPGFEGGTGASGELELVQKIGAALVKRLKDDGRFEVMRIPGRFPDEIKSGSFKVDAFIALHADGAAPTAKGYGFGFPPPSTGSKKFADLVAAEFAPFHISQRRQDNITTSLSGYYGWKPTRMPGSSPRIVVEHGFVTNPTERAWLFGHVDELAAAELRAIARLLGVTGASPILPMAGGEVTEVSKLISEPRATKAVLERYVLGRDHAPHTDDDARRVVKHYVAISARGGLDPLIAVAQMVLETNNLKSKWAQTHKNLAGIGVTGPNVDPALVPRWQDWLNGVIGHVGRLLAYAIPKGQENAAQKPLIEAALAKRALPDGKRGVAVTLAGLSEWAEDDAYVGKVVRLANEIRVA